MMSLSKASLPRGSGIVFQVCHEANAAEGGGREAGANSANVAKRSLHARVPHEAMPRGEDVHASV
jgi:hypothetical protein